MLKRLALVLGALVCSLLALPQFADAWTHGSPGFLVPGSVQGSAWAPIAEPAPQTNLGFNSSTYGYGFDAFGVWSGNPTNTLRPFQTFISGTNYFCVDGFHAKPGSSGTVTTPGIYKVAFFADGGTAATAMTPLDGLALYCVPFNPATWTDGRHEIRAIIYPVVGPPFVLQDSRGYSASYQGVSSISGASGGSGWATGAAVTIGGGSGVTTAAFGTVSTISGSAIASAKAAYSGGGVYTTAGPQGSQTLSGAGTGSPTATVISESVFTGANPEPHGWNSGVALTLTGTSGAALCLSTSDTSYAVRTDSNYTGNAFGLAHSGSVTGSISGGVLTLGSNFTSAYGKAALFDSTVSWTVQYVNAAAVGPGGYNYAVNDLLTLAGGTFTTATVLKVLSVDANGAILTFSIQTAGTYSVTPSNPVVQSSVSPDRTTNRGAAFTMTYVSGSATAGALAGAGTTTGNGYHNGDVLNIAGGSGLFTQATFTVSAIDGNGGITAGSISAGGNYLTGPSGIVTLSGGFGTGGELKVTSANFNESGTIYSTGALASGTAGSSGATYNITTAGGYGTVSQTLTFSGGVDMTDGGANDCTDGQLTLKRAGIQGNSLSDSLWINTNANGNLTAFASTHTFWICAQTAGANCATATSAASDSGNCLTSTAPCNNLSYAVGLAMKSYSARTTNTTASPTGSSSSCGSTVSTFTVYAWEFQSPASLGAFVAGDELTFASISPAGSIMTTAATGGATVSPQQPLYVVSSNGLTAGSATVTLSTNPNSTANVCALSTYAGTSQAVSISDELTFCLMDGTASFPQQYAWIGVTSQQGINAGAVIAVGNGWGKISQHCAGQSGNYQSVTTAVTASGGIQAWSYDGKIDFSGTQITPVMNGQTMAWLNGALVIGAGETNNGLLNQAGCSKPINYAGACPGTVTQDNFIGGAVYTSNTTEKYITRNLGSYDDNVTFVRIGGQAPGVGNAVANIATLDTVGYWQGNSWTVFAGGTATSCAPSCAGVGPWTLNLVANLPNPGNSTAAVPDTNAGNFPFSPYGNGSFNYSANNIISLNIAAAGLTCVTAPTVALPAANAVNIYNGQIIAISPPGTNGSNAGNCTTPSPNPITVCQSTVSGSSGVGACFALTFTGSAVTSIASNLIGSYDSNCNTNGASQAYCGQNANQWAINNSAAFTGAAGNIPVISCLDDLSYGQPSGCGQLTGNSGYHARITFNYPIAAGGITAGSTVQISQGEIHSDVVYWNDETGFTNLIVYKATVTNQAHTNARAWFAKGGALITNSVVAESTLLSSNNASGNIAFDPTGDFAVPYSPNTFNNVLIQDDIFNGTGQSFTNVVGTYGGWVLDHVTCDAGLPITGSPDYGSIVRINAPANPC